MVKTPQQAWEKKKTEISNAIKEVETAKTIDQDIIDALQEFLEKAKVRCSIEDYYEDTKG